MSIILPNLNHSFISLVPVPVPDSGSGSGSGFPGFPYALFFRAFRTAAKHKTMIT